MSKLNYNEDYYVKNNQNKDRLGLYFYSKVVKRYFRPSNVLDYGCGVGTFLNRLSKINTIKKLFGYDVSHYARKIACVNSKKSKILDDINKISKNSLDLITALHVIEHISDEALNIIFNNFESLLKENGSILFSTPAKNGIAHLIKKKNWIGYKDKTHINIKSFEEWELFFKLNNLKIIYSSNDGLWNFPYKLKNNFFKIIKILIIMTLQIYTGKLILSCKSGETFIFILKKIKSNDKINFR